MGIVKSNKPILLNLFICRLLASSGVVLSLEEVEVGLKGLKVQPEPAPSLPQRQSSGGGGTPFMAEHLEEALTGGTKTAARPRDSDMSAFNKLVNTMKASGTLPTLPKASGTNVSMQPSIVFACCFYRLLHAVQPQVKVFVSPTVIWEFCSDNTHLKVCIMQCKLVLCAC